MSSQIKMNASHVGTATNLSSQTKGFLGLPCDFTLGMIFWVVNGVLAALILAGNSLACAVFLKTRHLRRSYMNIYLVSLAISDMCMGALVMPLYSVFCTGCQYSLTQHCWFIRGLKGFTFGANILNLLAISGDRHEAFFSPLRYAAYMTKTRAAFILTAVWGLPVLVTGVRNIWQHSEFKDEALYIDRIYSNILIFILVIIPFFLLLVINLRILYVIKKQVQRIRDVNSTSIRLSLSRRNSHQSVNNAKKLKGTLACVVIVLVYILCWLPRIFYNFCYLFRRADLVSPLLIQLSLFFLFLQSSLNPFIYSFYRVEFRRAAINFLRCQTPSSDDKISFIMVSSRHTKK